MLVLKRKAGEGFVLSNVIKVTVLAVEGDRVKIGIAAPPDVIIVREELLDAPFQPTAIGTTDRPTTGGASWSKP